MDFASYCVAFKSNIVKLSAFTAIAVLACSTYIVDDSGGIYFGYLYIALILPIVGVFSRWAFTILVSFIALITLVYDHIDRKWGAAQLDSRLEVTLEAPLSEKAEYLSTHVDFQDVFALGLVVFLVCVSVWMHRAQIEHCKRMQHLAALAAVGWCIVLFTTGTHKLLQQSPPAQFTAILGGAQLRRSMLSSRSEHLVNLPSPRVRCEDRYKTIVFIIGESLSSDHMQVFGYSKRTTPFIQKSRPLAIRAISPSNQTRYSLAMMFTDATPELFDSFYRSHSIIAEFKACGFTTAWISNQGKIGKHDSFATVIANEADSQVFLNKLSYADVKFDEAVIPHLVDLRERFVEKRLAVFIHMIGSHTAYEKRYPIGFGVPANGSRVVEYDNTVRYTDYVLSRIYDMYFGPESLLVFLSDHGQVVTEDISGAGFEPPYQEEYRVPVLVWTEDIERKVTVEKNLDGRMLNTASFPSLVRYLMGIIDDPTLSTSNLVLSIGTEREGAHLYQNLREVSSRVDAER